MRTFRRILLISLAVIFTGTGLAQAQTLSPVVLAVEAPAETRQGEAVKITVTLADQAGNPLAGEMVTVYEVVRFFNNSDQIKLGEVRTDFQGQATLDYTPSVKGNGGLVAEYAGSETFAAATATTALVVAAGTLPTIVVDQPPLLPRGVNAGWVMILLIGVWLAFGAALYQVARIPDERERPPA